MELKSKPPVRAPGGKKQTVFINCFIAGTLTPILLCILQHGLAQVNVSGTAKTITDHEPVPFANVLLLDPADSVLVAGAVTGVDGSFTIPAHDGNYLLNVSMVGYRPVYIRVTVNTSANGVRLDDIYLEEDARQLSEVVVTGQRPLYEKEPGKTIINVGSSATAAGSTALEILERSPGVTVNRQNNSIGMNGRNNVLVMINGKVNRLPMDAVIQMLDGIGSESIEKIELITSPGARHDAEGDAGIVHIVMRESTEMGVTGNLSATLGYAKGESFGGNANLSRRGKRLNAFVNYAIQRDRNKHEWINEHFFADESFTPSNISNSDRRPLAMVQNFRGGVEYTFSDRTKANVLLTGYRRKWNLEAETINVHSLSEDSTRTTRMSIAEINRWQSASASFGVSHKFDERQELSVSFDYLYYDNDNPSKYNNQTLVDESPFPLQEIVRVEKLTPIHFRIGNVDYTNNFSAKFSLEAGGKVTSSQFTNGVKVERTIDETVTIDPELTNTSTLDERILATYVTWRWNPGEQWSVVGGARFEHTGSYLTSPSDGVLLDRSYGNLFPSLLVTHNFGEAKKLQMAYGRRITRPTFNDMAPFVFYIGPSTFVSGNLSLRPSITDAIDLSYQLRHWWISLKYSYTTDEIALLQPEFDPETNEQIFRSRNIDFMRIFGASATFPVTIVSWWEMHNEVSLYHHTYESQYGSGRVNRSMNRALLSSTSNFTLPRNFTVELSGSYQSALIWGLSVFEPTVQVNLGIRKKLKNEDVITLAFNDMLNAMQWKIETDLPEANIRSYTRYDWGTRSISITYSHGFGNTRMKAVEMKSGSESERSRVQ